MKPLTKKTKIILSVLVAVAVLVSGVVYWIAGGAQRLKNNMYELSKKAVLLQLKSPTTAQFSPTAVVKRGELRSNRTPDTAKGVVDLEGKEPETDRYYDVSFIVDAQNSYGAMMREYWSCYIIYYEGKDRFEDTDCMTLDDRAEHEVWSEYGLY